MEILGDSRLSRKSQVTVPKYVRDMLGLSTGDRIIFVTEKSEVLVKRGELRVENDRQLKSNERRRTN